MFVKEILQVKGSDVYTIESSASLADVVEELVARNCGSLVVREEGRMVGIITERDILRACAGKHKPLAQIPLKPVMSSNIVTVSPCNKVCAVMGLMTKHRFRHLPVVDEDGELVGLISIGDVVKAQHLELKTENELLKEYIQS
jgi:CBS domain-containing protein